MLVAPCTPTIAGIFISREIIALWDKRLPFSTISPFNKEKTLLFPRGV